MKVGTENILKARSVLAVERVQPAAAEEYTVYNGEVSEEPYYWYEYDAKGQIVSSSSVYTMSGEVDSFYVQKSSYDYSKGYPVLLDQYHYRESAITHEKTPFDIVNVLRWKEGYVRNWRTKIMTSSSWTRRGV